MNRFFGRARRARALYVLVSCAAISAGCGSGPDGGGGGLGEQGGASVAITNAPADGTCIRINVAGKRKVSRSFDVDVGASTVLTLKNLPEGEAVFDAEAFPGSCGKVTAATVATWVSDPVGATLVRGKLVAVTLYMHGNTGAVVSVDFPGDQGADLPASPTPKPFKLDAPKFPSVRRGPDAAHSLDQGRQALLERLQKDSARPVELLVDRVTGAVLTLDGEIALPGESAAARAGAFLATYLELLDPRLRPAEFRPATDTDCGESAVVLDRAIKGIPVLGSRLTLHFSDEGRLVQVVNGAAPAPAKVGDGVPAGFSGAPLAELLPRGQDAARLERTPVLLPAPDGAGLVTADLVSWPVAGQGFQGAVVLADGTAGTLVTKGNGRAGFKPGTPGFHLAPVDLPDVINYRRLAGVPANLLPGERNPVEAAYRYLDDHPAVFRSGAPRCQFSSGGIAESAALPGAVGVRMNQRYAGLPVLGAQLVVGFEQANRVMQAGGHLLPRVNLDLTPKVRRADAISTAKASIERNAANKPAMAAWVADVLAAPGTAQLVVYPGPLTRSREAATRLAWQVRLKDVSLVVDAQNARVLFVEEARHGARVTLDGEGRQELLRLLYKTVMVDGVATGALPLNPEVAGADADMLTTSSFYAALGWNGVNGGGSNFVANTNVAISSGCNNAFFTGFIGEAFFCPGMATNDVIGHEFTHGVIGSSSGLVYSDESGALNESLADLFGNLIFPDAASGSWLVGESAVSGALRDMATPSNGGQPGHISGYVPRSPACQGWPEPAGCDNGGVHTNSGITNRAFVLLTDGIAGLTAGIGRAKMARLAFITMTSRLTPWSRLNDVPMAMRDACDALVDAGGGGLGFAASDCDQVPIAFNQVGLNPTLSPGWVEHALEFEGTDTFFSGVTTTTGCNVTNVTAELATINGARMADLDPATGLPPAVDFNGFFGINFLVPPGSPPPPIGTTSQLFRVHWFDFFGTFGALSYAPQVVVAPPPLGAPDCITPVGFVPIERHSPLSPLHIWSDDGWFGASGTDTIGHNPSPMNPACGLTQTLVEITNDSGTQVIEGPAASVDHVERIWIVFVPVDLHRRASLASAPAGGADLSAQVNWSFDTGQAVRFRLRYYLQKPTFLSDCTP